MWHLMFFFMRSKQVTTSGAGKKKNSTEALKCHKLHFLCFLHFKAALKSEFIPTDVHIKLPHIKAFKNMLTPWYENSCSLYGQSPPSASDLFIYLYLIKRCGHFDWQMYNTRLLYPLAVFQASAVLAEQWTGFLFSVCAIGAFWGF